mmetsp:Transcript_14872/g.32115  ORF Transcript_14872/g.32115 Transcript_14872/m.32115 type:complete len:726 (-) Transcript_14872:118-2295(-)
MATTVTPSSGRAPSASAGRGSSSSSAQNDCEILPGDLAPTNVLHEGEVDAHLQYMLDPTSPPSMGATTEDSRLPRPRATLDFEDRREERKHAGLLKWQLEEGVPDVGGLGWRSRNGHLLKNQTFYSGAPKTNMWDNPTLAGPKTWKEFHGPNLRRDAPLMERLDRLDADQRDWDTKKQFVNAVRVQTLDRFYNKKVENQQKELASQWAPHKRTRRQIHQALHSFEAELDSMPKKELRKVLTPAVLQGDREAIRMITKKVQLEETWKAAWKQMEQDRHDDTRAAHEQRQVYNDMLMELAGQPGRMRQIEHKMPDSTTPRLRQLSAPVAARTITTGQVGVTELTDYKGLVHVDHKFALEALMPGTGHQMSKAFSQRATESAQPGWPPPPVPQTPRIPNQPKPRELPEGCLRKPSLPASASRVPGGLVRNDEETLGPVAVEQFLPLEAPPPRDQQESLLQEPLVNDAIHMNQDHSGRSDHTSSGRLGITQDQLEMAPPKRSNVYPVVVQTVEGQMQRPQWRPRRTNATQQAPQDPKWPPPRTMALSVRIVQVRSIPEEIAGSHLLLSIQIVGKPRSKVSFRVPTQKDAMEPFPLLGWKQGDRLAVSLIRCGIRGSRELIAEGELSSAACPKASFRGILQLPIRPSESGPVGLRPGVSEPKVEMEICPQESQTGEEQPRGPLREELSMPNVEPSMRNVCDHLDDFDATMRPVPRFGNFWLTPRGDMSSK